MISKITNNQWLTAIIFIGVVFRVIVIISTGAQLNDDWEYGDIAQNIVSGNGFSRISDPGGGLEQTSSHAPLYPIFLSIFYFFGQSGPVFLIIKLIQLVLSVLSILVMYKLGKKIVDNTTGLLCAMILACYPPYVYNTVKITPTVFFITLLIINLYIIFEYKNIRKSIVGGFLFGLMALVDALGLILLPVYLLIVLFRRREPLLNHLIFLAALTITLTPWTIRNYVVHKRIVPITTQFGINFWIGNNPSATGTDYYRIDNRSRREFVFIPETLPRSLRRALNSMSEIQRSDFFFSQAVEYIKNDPAGFITMLGRKTLYYWWFPPGKYSGSADYMRYRDFYLLCYVPLLMFGLIGIIIAFSGSRSWSYYIFICMILFSGIYIVTHIGLARYRLPVEVLLIIQAGFALRAIFFPPSAICKTHCAFSR